MPRRRRDDDRSPATRLALAAALPACLALTGCVRGLELTIAGGIADPVFRASPAWLLEPGKVCVTNVSVKPVDEDVGPSWVVYADGTTCPKIDTIQYGHLPPGFHPAVPARTLSVGVDYLISVTGHGWLGVCHFRFDTPTRATVMNDGCKVRR